MISSLSWIRSGVAREQPQRQQLTDAEYADIMAKIAANLPEDHGDTRGDKDAGDGDSSDSDLQLPLVKKISDLMDIPARSKDDGDTMRIDDESDEGRGDGHGDGRGGEHDDDAEREFEKLEDEEELEECRILPEDRLMIVGRTEDDVSFIDMYVYEQSEHNLYVHHDIMLPAVPLCLQPLSRTGSAAAQENLIAIGTFEPDIEVWDLDVLDPAYPKYLLKGPASVGSDKQKGSRKPVESPGAHAIMALSWNVLVDEPRYLLLAGCADAAIRLWDVKGERLLQTFGMHADKVQCVAWSNVPGEPLVFGSAAYDRTVRVSQLSPESFDVCSQVLLDASLSADPECLAWDMWHPGRLFVGLEDGALLVYDAGRGTKLTELRDILDDSPCSIAAPCPFISGLWLVAGGLYWKLILLEAPDAHDIGDGGDGRFALKVLCERTCDRRIFAASWCPDTPWLVAIAGEQAEARVIDLATDGGGACRVLINDLLSKQAQHRPQ